MPNLELHADFDRDGFVDDVYYDKDDTLLVDGFDNLYLE